MPPSSLSPNNSPNLSPTTYCSTTVTNQESQGSRTRIDPESNTGTWRQTDSSSRYRARTDNQLHSAREPETLNIRTNRLIDRPGHTKGADIGRLGQQVVDDEKKELSKNFEDVWYICAMAWHCNCCTIFVSEICFCEFKEEIFWSPSMHLNSLDLACVNFHLSIDYCAILVFVNWSCGFEDAMWLAWFFVGENMCFTIFLNTPQLLLYPSIWLFFPHVNSHWGWCLKWNHMYPGSAQLLHPWFSNPSTSHASALPHCSPLARLTSLCQCTITRTTSDIVSWPHKLTNICRFPNSELVIPLLMMRCM